MREHSKFPARNVLKSIFLTLFAVAVILPISPSLASGDPARCQANDEALKAIKPAETPTEVPDFAFVDAAGDEMTLHAFAGKGVVLNLWATWCPPCVREMPQLDALNAALSEHGIEVLAVSLDRGGDKVIKQFYEKTGIEHLAVLHDSKGKAMRALNLRGLPTTLIISPDGREMARIEGIHEYDTPATEAYLKRCIGGE